MNNSDLQRLKHIKTYCEDIEKTTQRFGVDFEIFRNDIDYLNSVSMSIMQIGELSFGLTDEFKHATGDQMQWGAIRGMRNLYAHAYAKMDKATIWETATIDIPGLMNFCKKTIERAEKEQQEEKPSVLQQLREVRKDAANHNSLKPKAKKHNEPER